MSAQLEIGLESRPLERVSADLVGAGYFGRFQYEAWNRIPEVTITAMCNRDPARGLAIQTEYGISKRYTDYRTMLETDIAPGPTCC